MLDILMLVCVVNQKSVHLPDNNSNNNDDDDDKDNYDNNNGPESAYSKTVGR